MSLYIYKSLFSDQRPESPTILINGYGDSTVRNQGSCTVVPLTGNQASQKAMVQVTDTREYLILGHETAQQIDYIHFTGITLPKMKQPLKMHACLKAMIAKAPKWKETSRTG